VTARDERRRALAEHLRAERQLCFGSKAKAVDASRVARATWDRLEAGSPSNDYTYARVEKVFGWPRGSMLRFLDDDGPLPSRDEEPAPRSARRTGQPSEQGDPVGAEGAMQVDVVEGTPEVVTALFAHYGARTTREKTEALLRLISQVQAESETSDSK
jgi:hypothetical protein